MAMYVVEFTNTLEDYGVVTLEADTPEDAEREAADYAVSLDANVIRTTINDVKEMPA